MTACSNKRGKAGRVITAALVGALSVGAPAVALATGGVDLLATAQENWQDGEFEFNVEANKDGSYTVTEGDALAFVGATDASRNEYGTSDVTVLYFPRTQGAFADEAGTIKVVSAAKTIAKRSGTMPSVAGDYWAVVYKGDIVRSNGDSFVASDVSDKRGVEAMNDTYAAFKLNVEAETTSLEGAAAYEVKAGSTDVSDKTFGYTGGAFKVGFEVGGKALAAADYDIVWISGSVTDNSDGTFSVKNAGTYKARLTGKNGYTGTADVTFTVKAVDLEKDSVSIAPSTSLKLWTDGTDAYLEDEDLITVNGSALADYVSPTDGADVIAQLIAFNGSSNFTDLDLGSHTSNILTVNENGKYTFKVTSRTSGSKDVTGTAIVDVYVVQHAVTYSYNGAAFPATFNPSKGSTFVPDAITATVPDGIGTKDVEYTLMVTKDGEEVSDYTEPGTYDVTLDTPVYKDSDGNYLYAGHYEGSFTVVGKSYANAKVYASYDGKFLASGADIEYTGDAVEPTVVVKDAKGKSLAEGDDYTWKLVDGDGEEVESATEVGEYKIVVEYNGTHAGAEEEVPFEVTKALIESVAPTADFFALPADGSAAAPTFYGYTEPGCEGQRFELSADEISVKYYEVKYDADGDIIPFATAKGSVVKASDLTEDGQYWAEVNVLTTAKSLEGTGNVTLFRLSKSAVFTDVDANAWYGGVVYEANELGYMKGITGTSLFMPNADITRAELACVMFNMAGGKGTVGVTYPTRFADVPEDSWFAQAVSWASQAGVVNGVSDTSFDSYSKATREQVVAMIYNYAKAQGKDVSVKDADAALAAYPDADQVSDWARPVVAWAVEQGIVGGNATLNPQDNVTRAEVAKMVTAFQPERLAQPWA